MDPAALGGCRKLCSHRVLATLRARWLHSLERLSSKYFEIYEPSLPKTQNWQNAPVHLSFNDTQRKSGNIRKNRCSATRKKLVGKFVHFPLFAYFFTH